MNMKKILASGAAALLIGLSSLGVYSSAAQAQTFRVSSRRVRDVLTVVMNRAVVVETDTPFVEVSIANPGIADISTLSDRSIYVLGKAPGRTTMTAWTRSTHFSSGTPTTAASSTASCS